MNVEVLRPDWDAPAHVRVLSTTRHGGVSAPPYDSLNLGLHVGDASEAVAENRQRLRTAHALPAEPRWLRQVHGCAVPHVHAIEDDTPADGAWSDRLDDVLAVLTADCLPVVLTDDAGSRVAVVHAGWRGLAAGVLSNAARALVSESPFTRLHAWLGPAIGPTAFEVGAEVRAAFLQRDAAHDAAFVPTDQPGKYLADLQALARRELAGAGDVVVTAADRCTVSEPTVFHSHRRDGAASGRLATVAWLAG